MRKDYVQLKKHQFWLLKPSKSSIIFPIMKLYHKFFSDKTQVVVLFKVTNPQNNIYAKFKTLNPQTFRLTMAQFF